MKQWITNLFRRRGVQMDCHQVGKLLQRYLDGHIDPDRAELIADHLEECRRCGLEAETYERIKTSLATHCAEVPQDAVDRLRHFGERLARGEESPSP
ncbi:MAG: zf-HC2 domain-containing protein [Acidimicrobiales bacterium]|nr:zf-HC2 domain-containing protein [Acidimicrobiales bacterium]